MKIPFILGTGKAYEVEQMRSIKSRGSNRTQLCQTMNAKKFRGPLYCKRWDTMERVTRSTSTSWTCRNKTFQETEVALII